MQAQLRIFAAKEIMAHPDRYPSAGAKPTDTANTIATAGVPVDSTPIFAFAQTLAVELRIWKYITSGRMNEQCEYEDSFEYKLNIIRPLPLNRKKQGPLFVAWLHLRDEHYKYLKPRVAPPESWVRLAAGQVLQRNHRSNQFCCPKT